MTDLSDLLRTQAALLRERTPRSLEISREAARFMPKGVPTSVYSLQPYPIVLSRGEGAFVWDADGNRYRDYALGFGVCVWGHAQADITHAITERAKAGVHFGALSEEVSRWSELLLGRFAGDWVRFTNSGSEATLDALRLARAHTGRNKIAKISGAYHGSHDYALIDANYPKPTDQGRRLWGQGLSPRLLDEVVSLPWNDWQAAEESLGEDIAALIIEPVLFNVGAIWPEAGYLEHLRSLCDQAGIVLIFDETKTGHTLAWGGAEEIFAVRPDIKTLGKGIGGGLPCGAILGTSSWGYDLISSGDVPHLGTFSGNPLVAAAGSAALQVMDKSSYTKLEEHRLYMNRGLDEIIARYELPAYTIGAGAKNCIVWSPSRLLSYDDYIKNFRGRLALLTWVWLVARDIWLAQGQDEQTTHSLAHRQDDADAFIERFAALAEEIRRHKIPEANL